MFLRAARTIASASIVSAALIGCASKDPFVSAEHPPGDDGAYYALPRALVPLQIVRKNCKVTVTPSDSIYVADPEGQYRLKIKHKWHSTDHLKVVTDANGLLTTINGDSTDQTSAILAKVIKLAAAFQGVPPISAGDEEEGNRTKAPCEKSDKGDFDIVVVIDPTRDPNQVDANKQLDGTLVSLSSGPLITTKPTRGPGSADCATAVCFRAARPYVITVEQRPERGFPRQVIRHVTIAPDPDSVMSVRFDRQLLATSDVKLTFTNGMMTSHEATKESEALALLQIPLDVASAILSLPSQLATVRVNNYGDDKKVLDAQAGLLRAQAELIAAQQQWDAARAKEAPQNGQSTKP